jgi:hypothetical protein
VAKTTVMFCPACQQISMVAGTSHACGAPLVAWDISKKKPSKPEKPGGTEIAVAQDELAAQLNLQANKKIIEMFSRHLPGSWRQALTVQPADAKILRSGLELTSVAGVPTEGLAMPRPWYGEQNIQEARENKGNAVKWQCACDMVPNTSVELYGWPDLKGAPEFVVGSTACIAHMVAKCRICNNLWIYQSCSNADVFNRPVLAWRIALSSGCKLHPAHKSILDALSSYKKVH